jgi:outer membrane protein assembly factor BamB
MISQRLAIARTIAIFVVVVVVMVPAGILYGGEGEHLLSINARTGSLIANTSLGAQITSLAVDTKTGMVYLTACKVLSLGCEGGVLIGFDGPDRQVRFSVPLSFTFIGGGVIDPATNSIYALVIGRNLTLLSIDGASGAIQYSSNIAACGVGAGGTTLAIDVASNQVYATASGQLLAMDATTGQPVNMLSAPGAQSVAVSPSGADVYLTMEAGSERFGYLLAVPSATGESYVNSAMLTTDGGCAP